MYIGDWEADSGYQAGLALAHERDCTAVYAANDQMAYGCILGLREAGKRVPEDVSVVGVDDSLQGIVPRLELTTMREKFNELGREAFGMILAQCNGDKLPVGGQDRHSIGACGTRVRLRGGGSGRVSMVWLTVRR